MNSDELLKAALAAISDRHGQETEAYDMRGVSILADYYVITSADSNRQLHAIANSLIEAMHKLDYTDYRIEGTHDSNWLLVDLGDVIINIFTPDARAFYGLEQLWSQGKQLTLAEE
ncbi:MAG: ribosome silencing factor [Lactobacillus sp.]|nr:ribosome silencing factor [Lactobacillus sp.]MCH3906058.1 ribosome silencing factor [Lactobacillus sp.]MCH3990368.1 ribosome silencing factor [Lactobacillus sp.]MCH4068917.1 ribosome silencing factor [Lactobacillus sp.]MCI1303319.1 ribosome silencing factor [Lactobacillus sp.]